jgi:glycosyltransferase involved in cell wall biosynthesis
MRICLNALNLQSYLGGIGWYCFYLAKHLKMLDPSLEITILTHKGAASQFLALGENVHIESFPFKPLWIKIIYFQCIFPFRLKKRFTLLHSVGNIGMLWCPIRQIITIHDTYEKVSPQRFGLFKRVLMGAMISHSARRAAGIITDSMNSFSDIARFYPFLKMKTSVIYMGNRFNSENKVDYKPKNHFLFVGTIEPGKNLSTIIMALALFNKGPVQTNLKVVGPEGWKQSRLFLLIKELGLLKNVEFCGYAHLEQLKGHYQSSIALICSSLYEGFCLPVIEALACGCPVIAARNSAIVESGDDCVVYFDATNEKDLAAKMAFVHSNPKLVLSNIHAGLMHAAKFTWEKAARETYQLYVKSQQTSS